MSQKTITINTYIIQNVSEESKNTQKVIKDLYSKFKTEENLNNHEYASEKLNGYAYIPNNFQLSNGRYVRYIDTTDAFNMILKVGGHVINDNGYTATLKNDHRIFKVSKKGKLFFMLMTQNDAIRSFVNKNK